MRRIAVVPALVLVAVATGFGAGDPAGTVGGVAVGVGAVRLAIDLNGRVTRTGEVPPVARQRVLVSPDGRWQAVLGLPGIAGNTGTIAMGRNVTGAPLRVVERHLYAGTGAVSWSPDSRWLAFTQRVPHLLSAVAVSVGGRRQVLAAPFCGDFSSGFAWGPAGDRIALGVPAPRAGCRQGVNLRIRAVGGGQTALIARGIRGVPAWSADGRWIATSGGQAEVMRANGTHRRELGGWLVAWSSRGHVLVVIDRAGRSLRVGSPAGSLRLVDKAATGTLAPSFSPDGRLIAYGRDHAIVVRRVVDRSIVTLVPALNAVVDNLAWARDGHSVLVDAEALRQGD